MPFIENVAYTDISKAWHFDPGENSMLIQIVDEHLPFPVPKYPFKVVRQFSFEDVEEDTPNAIQKHHASDIADSLIEAQSKRMNVVVHCVAGLCRSGAVVECGIALGFQDTEKYRQPNLRVKKMILDALADKKAI